MTCDSCRHWDNSMFTSENNSIARIASPGVCSLPETEKPRKFEPALSAVGEGIPWPDTRGMDKCEKFEVRG